MNERESWTEADWKAEEERNQARLTRESDETAALLGLSQLPQGEAQGRIQTNSPAIDFSRMNNCICAEWGHEHWPAGKPCEMDAGGKGCGCDGDTGLKALAEAYRQARITRAELQTRGKLKDLALAPETYRLMELADTLMIAVLKQAP